MTAPILNRTVAVYGALRSGTTLLRLMLDGHPKFTCPGETDFIFDDLRADGRYDPEALAANRIYRAHEAQFAAQPVPEPTPEAFFQRIAGPQDGIGVLILHRHLSRALRVFPSLRVVHLVRDPRDVARSSIGMGWAGTVYYGVDHWMRTQEDWQRSLPLLPEAQRLIVRYEDLISAPEETLGAICSFVGEEYHPDMMGYADGTTYSRPDLSLTLQWKRKQTPQDVGLVEAKIGLMLAAVGYAPSGHPPITPGRLEAARLWTRNKQGVWAWRIRRYGLRDSFLVAAARRLGLPALGAGAQQRMEAKQTAHLK